MKESFENVLLNLKKKPNLVEPDRGKKFHINIFQSLLNINKFKQNAKNSSIGSVLSKRFLSFDQRSSLKSCFKKGESNWIDVLLTKTKQYNSRVHTSTKLSPKLL